MTVRVNVSAVIIRDDKILLSEYDDKSGLHYNFPGGGVELNESLYEALHREVWEETGAKISIGRLLAVWEYIPPPDDVYGNVHKVGHLFHCELLANSEAHGAQKLDEKQTGSAWIALKELKEITLYPMLGKNLFSVINGELDDVFYGQV